MNQENLNQFVFILTGLLIGIAGAVGWRKGYTIGHATCRACADKPQPKISWYQWIVKPKILQENCAINHATLSDSAPEGHDQQ